MSLKKLYYDKGVKICRTCKFIDEYAFNVNGDDGNVPHGYDGSALCCVFNKNEKECADNRWFISPTWNGCKKYERCTEKQANYEEIFDFETQTLIPNPNNISKIK